MKRFCIAILLCCLLLIPLCACAESFTAVLPVRGAQVEVRTASVFNEEYETEEAWLFLPAFADLDAISILNSDLDWQLTPDEEEEGMWLYEGMRGEKAEAQIRVMQSASLRSVFLLSDDPETMGREYIESDPEHQLETTGAIALISPDGRVDYAGDLRQIRGRGNSSWALPKKPYQIKLEDKYDLLETGDPQEHSRTWLLISNAYDGSLLHNQIAMDLALEMGLSGNSRSEQVDLYYDGEYRGTYLLTEKPEVSNGRVEGLNYENLLQKWNRWIGLNDLNALPMASGVNRFGQTYYYVDGMADNGTVTAGTYLVQFKHVDPPPVPVSGFMVGDRFFELMNPEHASKDMVCYVSELFCEALTSLQHGGVHPETGRRAEELFDVESLAKLLLVFELGYNADGFLYSSTYFVLPEGGGPIQAGPVWDFDDAMRHKKGTLNAGYAQGLKVEQVRQHRNLMYDFYETPVFADAICGLYDSALHPLVHQVLLGHEPGVYLKSIDEYAAQIRASARMNDRLWEKRSKGSDLLYVSGFDNEVHHLKLYFEQRSEWLHQVMGLNGGTGADNVNITMQVEWAYPQEALHFQVLPWSRVSVQEYTHEQLTEADEENYALWQVDMVLAPDEGYAFSDPTILLNDAYLEGELQEDGTLQVSFLFEDLSYRPVDYYGDDIGLIYNQDFYIFNHPEALDACGGDEELLMDYFCDEGMYLGHRGNGFFDPEVIAFYTPHFAKARGDDLPSLYWDFVYYGFEEECWFESVDAMFIPPVHPVEQ